ncbi:hypothetical protein F2Q69_00009964 [Brassica cretica]|uniref:Gnk2-homologous domain-containing protein n=1 Tax=Brassica cretica TaxID=69181 RepID=A0A8S9PB99_BRACR|nr:hypothetical protein F2Q69_00009964 [Brassica cretica]
MLRYSDRNIQSTLNISGGFILHNWNVTSNQVGFRDLVLSTMNQAATEAANSSRKFDARKAYFNAFQDLYALVQCTPDLTSLDCFRSLNWTINESPTEKNGGKTYCAEL